MKTIHANQKAVPQKEQHTETLIETLSESEEQLDASLERELVLFKDEKNELDYIIKTIIQVCKISHGDAFDITTEANTKGHATITTGTFNELKPLRKGICEKNIWVEIL
ncbi:ATP-dependent Clp protease adaptor protein ClpS [Bernardetia litoralis DSM 6794]|uniref:ATP-dependent Clp protease adaptor protein ClpS n=1 Tax=Bernardetia litoralis (strain ATCC 23117 / DSM 6794 / NBRC 15988 / NCIMB 1366 / Fx l1 / Sio-4) TaxID=880071 RepID=I4AI28_BERLS|nr:ATP-dependent Clp protease adaptor ClpS [Bernardetia litoralis]AFM03613.1 ATP-dependent Clp protease adaptor protein ClpS [Bernardetia litoralis DSM 6794]